MSSSQNDRLEKIAESQKHTRSAIDHVLFLREIIAKSIKIAIEDWKKCIEINASVSNSAFIVTKLTAVSYLEEAIVNSIYPQELLHYGEKNEKLNMEGDIKTHEQKNAIGRFVETACSIGAVKSNTVGSIAHSIIQLTCSDYMVENCAEAAFRVNANTFNTRGIAARTGEIAETCKSLAAMIRECYRDRKQEFSEKADPLNLF